MKTELAVSFAAAVVCHALVLFGFRFETPAHPLAMDDQAGPVDVSLVDAAPAPPSAPSPAEAAETPAPEAQPTPDVMPEPAPTPEPVAPVMQQAPAPTPVPAQEEAVNSAPTPEPHHETGKPHPAYRKKSAASSTSPRPVVGPTGSGSNGGGAEGTTRSASPRYRSNPRPEYPSDALRMRQEGVVMLNVQVSADGRASSVSLKRSSGVPSLDDAALEAVRRWTFEPAMQAGFPVASQVEVPVRFRLEQANR